MRGKERDQNKRSIDQLPSIPPLIGDHIQNKGMCSEQELNSPPFGVWEDALTN